MWNDKTQNMKQEILILINSINIFLKTFYLPGNVMSCKDRIANKINTLTLKEVTF